MPTLSVTDARDWAEQLQVQERRGGLDAIYDMWNARKRINLDLPTDSTPEARYLWGTFVKHLYVVGELLDYAVELRDRTGVVYPHLYELCINYWLPRPKHHRRALDYHRTMRHKLGLEKLPLQHLAGVLRGRLTPDMYGTLLEMYEDSNEVDLYNDVVPELSSYPRRALEWHATCILRRDLPSREVASTPMVRSFLKSNATTTDPEVRVLVAIAASSGQPESEMDAELLDRLRGRDTPPVRFEDSFCARMFATRALPTESVINGLALVGVNEIGPLAIRAMASRTDPISDLLARFDELRAAGIALQGCIFSLALEKFTKEGNFLLVRSMLESDQHPEVYDDLNLQKQLLEYYIQQQDWQQAHRTLAILSMFYLDASTHAWNLLLNARIEKCAPAEIFHTLKSMAQYGIRVDQLALKLMTNHILGPRRSGRLPVQRGNNGFDDLRFVARMYTFMLEHKLLEIPPLSWREILRRFGMTYRMRELRLLVHWLFRWYAPRGSIPLSQMPKPGFPDTLTELRRGDNPTNSTDGETFPQTHKDHPLRLLFPDSFQQGLIVWGFRAALLHSAPTEQSLFSDPAAKKHFRQRLQQKGILTRPDWSIGLQTLIELRHLHLFVNSATVVKTLQRIFVILFGRGHSRIKHNRIMEAVNTTTYPEYVDRVNELWGTPLFTQTSMYGRSKLHKHMWHPRFNRVVDRKNHVKLDEIAAGLDEDEASPSIPISYYEVDLSLREHGVDATDDKGQERDVKVRPSRGRGRAYRR